MLGAALEGRVNATDFRCPRAEEPVTTLRRWHSGETWSCLLSSARMRRGSDSSFKNLYQAVKASPELLERSTIANAEAIIRNIINELARTGFLERLGKGDYRLPAP